MATTDINGMVFYTVSDPVEPLQTLLNGISTATTNALNANVRIFSTANATTRNALAVSRGASTSSPLVVYRQDTLVYEYTTDGITWTPWITGPGWRSYTPTLTNASLGNGTLTAQYNRSADGTVVCAGQFILGTTSSVTSTLGIGLPVPATGVYNSVYTALGPALMQDTSAGALRIWTGAISSSTVAFIRDVNGATVGATAPWTWASTDVISWNFTYRG